MLLQKFHDNSFIVFVTKAVRTTAIQLQLICVQEGRKPACFYYSSLFTENGRNLRIIQLYQNKQHA